MKENVVMNKSYAFALRIIKAYESINADCTELIKLLISIVKTSKETYGKKY